MWQRNAVAHPFSHSPASYASFYAGDGWYLISPLYHISLQTRDLKVKPGNGDPHDWANGGYEILQEWEVLVANIPSLEFIYGGCIDGVQTPTAGVITLVHASVNQLDITLDTPFDMRALPCTASSNEFTKVIDEKYSAYHHMVESIKIISAR